MAAEQRALPVLRLLTPTSCATARSFRSVDTQESLGPQHASQMKLAAEAHAGFFS